MGVNVWGKVATSWSLVQADLPPLGEDAQARPRAVAPLLWWT